MTQGLPPDILKLAERFLPDPNKAEQIHLPLSVSFDEAIQIFNLLKTLRADRKAE